MIKSAVDFDRTFLCALKRGLKRGMRRINGIIKGEVMMQDMINGLLIVLSTDGVRLSIEGQ